MKNLSILAIILMSVGIGSAQSLKPDNPYPLRSGINQGTSDSLVGTHYWYFYATPGTSRITVRLRTATTLYGAALNNTRSLSGTSAAGGR
jgi:hypothetical protein